MHSNNFRTFTPQKTFGLYVRVAAASFLEVNMDLGFRVYGVRPVMGSHKNLKLKIGRPKVKVFIPDLTKPYTPIA